MKKLENIPSPVRHEPLKASQRLRAVVDRVMFARKSDYDNCFRMMERELVRRERLRLIRSGVIIPAYRMQPTPLVKNEQGQWKIGTTHGS